MAHLVAIAFGYPGEPALQKLIARDRRHDGDHPTDF